MKLVELFKNLPSFSLTGNHNLEAKGLSNDSRTFEKGDVFVAIRGEKYDGHIYVAHACRTGAVAVVVENDDLVPAGFGGAVVKVKDTKAAQVILAENFFRAPSEKMFVVGVTGTNGKTTTTHIIENLLNPEKPTAVMGTIDYHFGKHVTPSTHTTPDVVTLQKLFREWADQGAEAVSMEVSSHAIVQHRVDPIHFDVAVFTNLTRDHLDFHKTMEDYQRAKSELFFRVMDKSKKKAKKIILNADDPYFEAMINPKMPVWTYGVDNGDFKIRDIELSLDHSQFELQTPVGMMQFRLPMIGLHNVYNATAAIAVGVHAGFSLLELVEKLDRVKPVKGRLERVKSKNPVRVFVDYAHTDDALMNVLTFLKKLRDEIAPKNRIITVFGCGGDRDRGKRPLMMEVARRYSQMVVVTSDNPRTENPSSIIKDIIGDMNDNETKVLGVEIIIEEDRAKAIELAIKKANPGDIVLIAGKGHEDYQIIGTQKFAFDDYKIASKVLK